MVSTHICVEKELANGASHTNGIFIHIIVSLKARTKVIFTHYARAGLHGTAIYMQCKLYCFTF